MEELERIPNWPTILNCIQYGLAGDIEKMREYAELLLERMREEGQERFALRLRCILDGKSHHQMVGFAQQGEPPEQPFLSAPLNGNSGFSLLK